MCFTYNVKLDLDLHVDLLAKMSMYASAMQVLFEHMVGRFIFLSYKAN